MPCFRGQIARLVDPRGHAAPDPETQFAAGGARPASAAFPAFRRGVGTPCIDCRSASAASRSSPASLNGPRFNRSSRAPRGGLAAAAAGCAAPQHCLNLRPLPHGQGSLRPARSAGAAAGALISHHPRMRTFSMLSDTPSCSEAVKEPELTHSLVAFPAKAGTHLSNQFELFTCSQ